ncbi:MAG: hypothetical protein ABSF70_07995 [Terracidiphilus sp.]|jgi:hypothetical protein
MQTEERCIELRVAYPGSRVSAIGLGCLTGNFRKAENPFLHRYDRLADGREQHIHLLPDCDLTYEVEEVVDCKRIRWYCATLEGDTTIHRISQYGAKVYARREMSLCDVVREYPERVSLADYRDEED